MYRQKQDALFFGNDGISFYFCMLMQYAHFSHSYSIDILFWGLGRSILVSEREQLMMKFM